MKRILLSIILMLFISMLYAQRSQKSIAIKRIFNKLKYTKTIKASFIQKKKSSLFASISISRGSFYLKQPKYLRWEYTKPIKSVMLIVDNNVTIKNITTGNVQKLNLSSVPVIKSLIYNLFFGFMHKQNQINSEFYIKERVTSSYYVITLKPKKALFKKYLKVVKLFFDKNRCLMRRIIIFEAQTSDKTEIFFTNIKTNISLANRVFTLK